MSDPIPPNTNPTAPALLLVEDDRDVRFSMIQWLDNFPYQVLEAAEGTQAVELCRTHPGPIGAAVVDMCMPGMWGNQFADELKWLRPGTPVIYVSGSSEEELKYRGLLRTGDVFFQKPFVMPKLMACIAQLMQSSAARLVG